MSNDSPIVTGELVPSQRDHDYATAGALDLAPARRVPARPAQPFDVRRIVHESLRGRYILAILLGLLTGAAFGAVAWKMSRPIYYSEGIVRIAYTLPTVLQETEQNRPLANFEQFMMSQRMVITSRRVLEMAARDPIWRQRGGDVPAGLTEFYAENAKVDIRPRSEFMAISVTDTDPGMAAAAVVALVNAYADYFNNQEKHVERQRLGLLEDRQHVLQGEMDQLSAQLRVAAQEYGSTRLDPFYDAAVARLTRLETELANVRLSIAGAPAAPTAPPATGVPETTAPATAAAPEPTTRPAPDTELTVDDIGMSDPAMHTYLEERERLQGELKRLEALKYGEAHRDVVATRQALTTLDDRIERYAAKYRKFRAATATAATVTVGGTVVPAAPGAPAAPPTLETLRASEASLRKLHAETKQEVAGLGNRRFELMKLEADLAARKEEHTQLSRRIDVLRAEGSLGGRLSIISSGEVSQAPLRDTRLRSAAAGGLAGTFIPAGALILLGFIRRKYRFSDETEADLAADVPLLGILPEHSGKDAAATPAAAHSVHQIRVSLAARMRRDQSYVYLVTSATAGEGKTTISASLALSFAAARVRTLLIDCDLVGRHLTSSLGAADTEGVRESLQSSSLLKCVRKTQSGLYILTAGKAAAADAVSIPSDALRAVLAEARRYFRVIIIDSGPILGSLEAAVIAQESDGVIFAITRGQHRELVQRAMRRLGALGTQIVGFIFNRAKTEDFHRSSYASSTAVNEVDRAVDEAPAWQGESLKHFSPLVQAVAAGMRAPRD
jgi:polysaccharide biosynthesis transport protein